MTVAALLLRFEKAVWGVREERLPPWKTRALTLVRTVAVLARDLATGQLTLRAMSLVYTTLLAIVPLLALSFSVLKGFGVSNQIRPMLLSFLGPLGEKGEVVAQRIIGFIDNISVGVLGAVGLALLLYTAISLMQKIEESLNFIWHVPRARRLAERFSRYVSVLLVGPLLVFSALGVTAAATNADVVRALLALDGLGQAARALGAMVPYLLVMAAFTFVYMFIPNTAVHFGPALVGGVVGGIAWQTAGWAFATFVATSNNYAAIYSGFAILVLFMVWLYLSWLILLFGASVAFYVQHPEYLYTRGGEPHLSSQMRERLALSAMSVVASRFLAGEGAPSLPDLTRVLGVPMYALQNVLDALEDGELLVQSTDNPPAYLPARDPSRISVTQVLDTVRAAGEDRFFAPEALPAPQPVDEMLDRMQRAIDLSVGDISMRELAGQDTEHAKRARLVPQHSR